MRTFPNKPQKPTQIVKTAVVFWVKNFKQLIPFLALLTFLLVCMQVYTNMPILRAQSAGGVAESKDFQHTMAYQWFMGDAATAAFNPFVFAAVLIFIIASIIIGIAMIYHIHQLLHNKQPKFSNSIKVGLKKSIPYVVVCILYGLMTMIGMVFLIIPGVFLMIAFLFAPYLLVTKNAGIIRSLKESFALVQNNWWRTFWTIILGGLIQIVFVYVGIFIVFLIFMMGALVYEAISHFIPFSVMMISDLILLIIIDFLYSAVSFTFFLFLVLCLMYDLQVRHEKAKKSIIQKQ